MKYKKILEVDGCEIYLTEENILDFYGFFDSIYKDEYLKKINTYLKNTIYKVKDEQLRDKIVEIANLDLSRNSQHHIFNIEILVTCALKKPQYFFFIHTIYYIINKRTEFKKEIICQGIQSGQILNIKKQKQMLRAV